MSRSGLRWEDGNIQQQAITIGQDGIPAAMLPEMRLQIADTRNSALLSRLSEPGAEPAIRTQPETTEACSSHQKVPSPGNGVKASMVGARAREIYDRQAKERQQAGQEKGGATAGRGRSKDSFAVTVPESNRRDSRDEAGKAVGVSGKLIDHATNVLAKGGPGRMIDYATKLDHGVTI